MKWLIGICGLGVLVYALSHTSDRASKPDPELALGHRDQDGKMNLFEQMVQIPKHARSIVVTWTPIHPLNLGHPSHGGRASLSKPIESNDECMALLIRDPSETHPTEEMQLLILRSDRVLGKIKMGEISLPFQQDEYESLKYCYAQRTNGTAFFYAITPSPMILKEKSIRSIEDLKSVYPESKGIWLDLHFE